jgi:hypothetical protein
MDRFCTRHTHRGSSRAYRLVLARHSLDADAHQSVIDEHGDCPECWRATAVAAVDAVAGLLIKNWPLPEMQPSGVVTGPTVDWLLRTIDVCLEAEQLDRRDLERGP